jgi:CHAT domain-containing protein
VDRGSISIIIKSKIKDREPVVFADPDFDLRSEETTERNTSDPSGPQTARLFGENFRFPRLPGTRIEGENIAHLLGVQPLLAGRALKATLRSCRSPRFLHFATHGFFLADEDTPVIGGLKTLGLLGSASFQDGTIYDWTLLSGSRIDNPLLRSGLALAGANTALRNGTTPPEAEDGIVTAEDASSFDLRGTQLVVLSACDTGMGLIRTGGEVLGLRRAFKLAGATTVIMSLWKVPDSQTQELMDVFYKRILQGQPRVSALREAQLVIKAKYKHPGYWGAFICEGDPGPLASL